MREVLLIFILAIIVGSIINGWPKPSPQETHPKPIEGGGGSAGANTGENAGPRRDFPDFNSFPSLDSASFNDLVMSSDKPVFVICFTPNNLSCERMIPIVAAMAKDHADSIKVTKLNIMENVGLAQKYQVYAVPTFMVFSKGQLTAKLTGIVAKDQLEAMITPVKP